MNNVLWTQTNKIKNRKKASLNLSTIPSLIYLQTLLESCNSLTLTLSSCVKNKRFTGKRYLIILGEMKRMLRINLISWWKYLIEIHKARIIKLYFNLYKVKGFGLTISQKITLIGLNGIKIKLGLLNKKLGTNGMEWRKELIKEGLWVSSKFSQKLKKQIKRR